MLEDGMEMLYYMAPFMHFAEDRFYRPGTCKHGKTEAQYKKAIAKRRKRNKNKKTHRRH